MTPEEHEAALDAAIERYDARMQRWLEAFAVQTHRELRQLSANVDMAVHEFRSYRSRLEYLESRENERPTLTLVQSDGE